MVAARTSRADLRRPHGKHRAPAPVSNSRRTIARVGAVTLLTGPAWVVGAVTFSDAANAAPSTCTAVGQGARGDVVKTIQRTVGATADGAYGPKTAAAVRAWQIAHGLPASGTVDAATWATFPGGGGCSAPGAPAPAAAPGTVNCPTIQQGSRGNAVVILQRRVGASADGAFGPLTRAAVVRTQTQLHVPATGVVDTPAWTAFGLVDAVCTVTAASTPAAPVVSTAATVAAQVAALIARPDAAVTPTAAAVIAFARAQLGIPYVTGGASSAGYDCSGLVLSAYASAGIATTRTAAQQYVAGPQVSLTDLRPGDTVYYATDLANPATIYHTAIYIGGGQMIEAAKPGTLVREVPLRTADLFPAGARPAAPAPAPANAIVLPASNPSSGFTARSIQTRLVAHGAHIAIDGAFGPKTQAAVVAFQRSAGLPPTGVVDVATWAALQR